MFKDHYAEFTNKFIRLLDDLPDELVPWFNPHADYGDAIWIDVPMRKALLFWSIEELEAGADQPEGGPWAMILNDEVTIGGDA